MSQKSGLPKPSAVKFIKDIRETLQFQAENAYRFAPLTTVKLRPSENEMGLHSG